MTFETAQWVLDIVTLVIAFVAIIVAVWAVRRSGIRARQAEAAAESASLAAERAQDILMSVESYKIEAAQWADVARKAAADAREARQSDRS